MAPVNKPTRLLSKEINDTIFSKMVRPNCVSLVTTVATLFFFSGKDFIPQIVGVVCFECDLRSKCNYLRIYNLEDNDLFFDKKIGSNGIKLNSEDPLFFKIDFDCGTIGLRFKSGPEANMEAKELEKALRAGKIIEEIQPVIEPVMKKLDNKSVTQLDFANDPMLREIITLMGLEYSEVVKSQKMQANLRELIHNLGGTEKFLVKLKARPPDHKAMRAKARADQQKQDKQAVSPSMQTLKLNPTAAEISLQQSTESQSKTETKSYMPEIEVVQPLEPRGVQKTSLLTTKLSSATSVTNAPLSSLQSTGAAPLSSEAMRSPTISTKIQPNCLLESSQTAPMSQKATPTKLQQNYSKLIQSPGLSPQVVKSPEASPNHRQPINNSPQKESKSFTTEKSLQSPQPHPNGNSGLPKMSPQTKTVDPSPTISSPPSVLPPAVDGEIPIPGLKYALPNVRRKVRAVARDGLPEREHDGIDVPQPNPVRRNIGWVGKTVRPEKEKDDIQIPGLNGTERNVGRPCGNILKKPEDESTRWTAEKLEKWQHDPMLIEILKLWGLKYEDFFKSEKWQDTLEALIKINGGAENLVKKRLEAISKSEAEKEIPKPKINKLKIPIRLGWAQEKADDSPESESQAEISPSLPKTAVEQPTQHSQEQTAYPMPANQPPSPPLQAQKIMHQDPSSVSPMSSRPEQSQITPVKKHHNHPLESSQTLESQTTPATNQQLNYSPLMSQTSLVSSKTTVQSQMTPVKSLEPIQSSILTHQALQSPMVPMQQNYSPESSRSILSSHTSNTGTSVIQKPLKSPLAPTKSSTEKLPSSPNKLLHPIIFAKHPSTPKPSVFTKDEDGSIYFARTPKNDKENSGKIQPIPNESIKHCPASGTPRTQLHDDDDDEYQRNANLRDNWQKRVQNRTPAPPPSTPVRSLAPESENKMLDAKGSGQKTTENVKNDTDKFSNSESKMRR